MNCATSVERDAIYIDGKWIKSTSAHRIEVIEAATEQVMGRIPAGSAADVDQAVIAARAAFETWSQRPAGERTEFLDSIAARLKERQDEIARIITREVGTPLKFAQRAQAAAPAFNMSLTAKLAREYAFEEAIGNSLVVREPIGVVGCITPWNYPLHQVVAKVAPALAVGCTVVLKPSEVAPLSAFILADVIHEVGLPKGVFNLVSGEGAIVGEAIAAHPGIDMVSFTGSTRAGKRVSELAAGTVKRVALELGGKSAAIILDDANLPSAVKGVLAACFQNSGQTCSAHTRMLVPESLYEEAATLAKEAAAAFMVGDPFAETTRIGPLISAQQRERVRAYIETGLKEGATLLTGGPEAPAHLDKGYFVKPTVFGRVDPQSTIAQEEIFGPVLSIITYKDEEEAIGIANNTIYGLAGGVWSADEERAKRVGKRMRTGQVDINGAQFNLQAPFGGYKQSGNGREFGKYGLEEFLEVKAIQLKVAAK